MDGMHMVTPACKWEDALPCGNGHIGAMMYGNICHETILLNHELLWDVHEKPRLSSAADCIPEVRRLLLAGKYQDAERLFNKRIQESHTGKKTVDAYQPGPDFCIDMDTSVHFSGYRRGVDFSKAEVFTAWNQGEAEFRRRLFVSRADGIAVLNISSSFGGLPEIAFRLLPHGFRRDKFLRTWEQEGVDPAIPYQWNSTVAGCELCFHGRYPAGAEFTVTANILTAGGKIQQDGDSIKISGVDEVNVLIDFSMGPPHSIVWPECLSYQWLLERHEKLHGELYSHAELRLSKGEVSLSNEELFRQLEEREDCLNLLETMFHYGKYLFLCAAGENGLPVNMRGIWNGDYLPSWESDYHNNEELPMTYWLLAPCGFFPLAYPYFKYYEDMCPDYEENAQKVYGVRGILLPHCQSTHGLIYAGRNADAGHWAAWTAGAGWIASLFYQYWEYTGDDVFLREHALPFLKKAAAFYEDFLVEGKDGKLCFVPSLSPENIPNSPGRGMLAVNAAMDIAVARQVLDNLISACQYLRLETDRIKMWESIRRRLPDYQINSEGALKEWSFPEHPDHYAHRHLSHLYPVFPGEEITEEKSPKLFTAAEKALDLRKNVGLGAQTGWSFIHMAAVYARLGKNSKFFDCLVTAMRSCVGANLFFYHNDWRGQGLSSYWGAGIPVPIHICANFGLTAAVLEALVQSGQGWVSLLPAKPEAWRQGELRDVFCKGQIRISVLWKDDSAIRVELKSEIDQLLIIKFPYAPELDSRESNLAWSSLSGKEHEKMVALKSGCMAVLTCRKQKTKAL